MLSATSADAADVDGQIRAFVFHGGPTDGTVVVRYRLEQSALREYLRGSSTEVQCDICWRVLPVRFVVTAHIKPRQVASEAERVEPNIVFAACLFSCDVLFELGHITVDGQGIIQPGYELVPESDLAAAVQTVVGRRVGRFSEHNAKYFRWHRNNSTSPDRQSR